MIDDKVIWMFKISIENVIRIKSFQIYLKNDYANDVDKMMCHYIDNVVIKLFIMIKNDYQSFNMSIDRHNELQDVGN
jgi:hypothetical protein